MSEPYDQPTNEFHPPQQQYGTAPYGQPDPYGYGQPAAYGYEQQYGQFAGYAEPLPSKPGGVVTAAVFGFLFGAAGTLVTLGLGVGAFVLTGVRAQLSDVDGLAELGGAAVGLFLFIAVLALSWTVLMIWGSIWALTGRNRAMLITGSSIGIGVSGLLVLSGLADGSSGSGGGLALSALSLAAAIAVVVLLSMPSASRFFAAHRAARAYRR